MKWNPSDCCQPAPEKKEDLGFVAQNVFYFELKRYKMEVSKEMSFQYYPLATDVYTFQMLLKVII